VNEDAGLKPGYKLKLNSYDLGVDIELADAVQRLRFSGGSAPCVRSPRPHLLSGANAACWVSHPRSKVNCLHEGARLAVEDATEHSMTTSARSAASPALAGTGLRSDPAG
jgi:benzoyl-CoA-dihydrodiol lyase